MLLPTLTIRPLFGGLFDQKNLSSEDAEKWPNVLLFGIINSENMSNHSSTKNFGKSRCKLRPADVMTFLFFSFFFWASLVFRQKNGHLRT